MSELKVAVMTGTGQYMTAAGCMNPGVRQTGFIETTTMLRFEEEDRLLRLMKEAFEHVT